MVIESTECIISEPRSGGNVCPELHVAFAQLSPMGSGNRRPMWTKAAKALGRGARARLSHRRREERLELWVEAFLDYEVGGQSPVQPKASEAAVRADLGEVLQREAIVKRLQSIRIPTILLRAERGFTPDQPPLFPDELAGEIRGWVPHLEDHKFTGTTHYTIALCEHAAAKTADIICELAHRLRGAGKAD